MYFLRDGIYFSLEHTEGLKRRDDVRLPHDRENYLSFQQTVLNSSVPSRFKDLSSLDLFDLATDTLRTVQELLGVLDCEPAGTPHEIVRAVVEPITIEMYRGVELETPEVSHECFSDENSYRPLALVSTLHETDDGYASSVRGLSHYAISDVVADETCVAY